MDYAIDGRELAVTDRQLFMKYALPCAGTLVKRGSVTQTYIDRLVDQVSNGQEPEKDCEKIFLVANVMCSRIARSMEKSSVDSEVIRRYFLFEHSEVVDDRFELMKDFNPVDCKTYAGRIIELDKDYAVVETRLGRKRYKTMFAKDANVNDSVVVHFDFIVERIPPETARKIDDAMNAYEKRN